MSLNIHPIFVHFPIALLSVYVLLEVLRFKVVSKQSYIFYLKAIFVIFGTIGAGFALLTGKIAEELVNEDVSYLVHVHQIWAILSSLIFGIIALCYFVAWINKDFPGFLAKYKNNLIWKILLKLSDNILKSPLIIILALIGFVAITITGALGGIIVYGQNSDPFAQFIYTLFFNK